MKRTASVALVRTARAHKSYAVETVGESQQKAGRGQINWRKYTWRRLQCRSCMERIHIGGA